MVKAYRADPKTGLVMLLMTPEEIEAVLALIMRGILPGGLRNRQTTRLLRGFQLVNRNFPAGSEKEEEDQK